MSGGTTRPAGMSNPPQTPRSADATASSARAGVAFEPNARVSQSEGATPVSLRIPARGRVAIDVPRSFPTQKGVARAAA